MSDRNLPASHLWGFLARRMARGENLVVVAVAAGVPIDKMRALNEEPVFQTMIANYKIDQQQPEDQRAAYRRQLIETGKLPPHKLH